MKEFGRIDRSEGARLAHMLKMERELHVAGYTRVAGIDEAGRGPLAGPVCTAAVIFEPGKRLGGINDSKQVTPERREQLYNQIMEHALAVGVGLADAAEIDAMNILNATKLAAQRALRALPVAPDYVITDALTLPNCPVELKSIVKGDEKCFSIAAASIIAKVTRDRLMDRYAEVFPQYSFDQHKGYATKLHLDRIEQHGVSSIHRRSFFDPGFFGGEEIVSEHFTRIMDRLRACAEESPINDAISEIRSLNDFLPRSEILRLMDVARSRLADLGCSA